MRAMILNKSSLFSENSKPLELVDVPIPVPNKNEVLLRILVCGVCHTELDEIEGRIASINFPIIPGHQIIGRVEKTGEGCTSISIGERVGVAWIYSACGVCNFCIQGNENLCDNFVATGKDVNGGYAEYITVPENYVYAIPENLSDIEAAPLLCAGAIGYRSVMLCKLKNGQNLGLYGFGASAHLVLKLVQYLYPKTQVFVFTRKKKEQVFALKLHATWAGTITQLSSQPLDCIIDTTPVWKPIINALYNLKKGGRLVINSIRKENIDKQELLNISYPDHLWMEKEIKSVANITRKNVRDFLNIAAEANLKPVVDVYPLEEANEALLDLLKHPIKGAKVLRIASS